MASVQVSPPQEHAVVAGAPWWQRYQPVSYSVERSRSGTRAEFVSMVARCRAAGVDVYVTADLRHHPASDHLAETGAPALVDVAHWASEHPWCAQAAGVLEATLPGVEVDGTRVLTSEQALRLDEVPRSVVVLGGGVIGVEFASVWRSFGAEVTILEALPHLVPSEDEQSFNGVSAAAYRHLLGVHRTATGG